MRVLAAVLPALLCALSVLAAPARGEVIGRSVEGRPIRATYVGDRAAPVIVLAVGSIHGNETAGHDVIRALRRRTPPAGVGLWLITTANPDGVARGTRQNARGVDLNRNFPHRWRAAGRPWDPYHAGRAAGSEPETRAIEAFVQRVRPARTVWLHQALGLVNHSAGADPAVVRAYARRSGLPDRRLPAYRGTVAGWQNASSPGSSAFVVELRAGRLGPAALGRQVRAVLGTGADAADAGRAQLEASLALTRWLRERFGIARSDVIGHAESVSSPHHRERAARLRTQFHRDMRPATMRRYRSRL